MGLGIQTEGIYKIYSIPLFGVDDPEWEDNTWICEHLRHLARKIEEVDMKIYQVSIEFDKQYKSPQLVLTTFKK